MVLINEQWVFHSRVAKVMIMGQQLNKSGNNIANVIILVYGNCKCVL